MAFLNLSGAITVILAGESTFAQSSNIVPDSTLGSENSSVTPRSPGSFINEIRGGAVRGNNLFHSFSEFNVNEGSGAYFYIPNVNIQNILTRVIGSNRSEILGTIGTFGNSNPNLFLINPNGIIIGSNARLDVGGSFVATTANAVGLGNQGFFSASNPDNSLLLSVNPSALFFNQIAAAPIQISSATSAGLDPAGFDAVGLQVPSGQSLILVGGDINLDGGRLNAFGGRVELGGLAEAGTVDVNVNGKELSLRFPDEVARADVQLSNFSSVIVSGEDGGSIAFNARNISISEGSVVFVGLEPGLGILNIKAGNITLNATEAIEVKQSIIINSVELDANGDSGSIDIKAGSLSLSDGAGLITSTSGQGDAGMIAIDVRGSVSFEGLDSEGFPGGAFSTVDPGAVGNSGGIDIKAGSLSLSDGAGLITSTSGQGDAGMIAIDVRGSVSFEGLDSEGFPGGAFSTVDPGAVGNSGGIDIKAGSLALSDGARLVTSTSGQGDAGRIAIDVRGPVSFEGLDNEGFPGGAFSTVGSGAVGSSGGIDIKADSLALSDGAQLQTLVRAASDTLPNGIGNAEDINIAVRDTVSFSNGSGAFSSVLSPEAVSDGGNINIITKSISLNNGGQLASSMSGQGNGGSINIKAEQLTLSSNAALVGDLGIGKGRGGNIKLDVDGQILLIGGETAPTGESTRITLGVLSGGTGTGGDLRVNAGSFVLRDGAIVKASNQGQGSAGSILINADVVDISGSVPTSGLPSGLFTSTVNADTAGNITVNTDSFRIADGAVLSVRTLRDGQGGNITVNATGAFEALNGGQLVTTTSGSGQAGNIVVNADQVTLSGIDSNYSERIAKFPNPISPFVANDIRETGPSNGLFAQSQGTGNAGSIIITAKDTLNANNGNITTTATESTGGAINIKVGDIRLRGDSDIRTNVFQGAGGGGNITIKADSIIAFDDSDIFAFSRDGRGGNIILDTPVFLAENFRLDTSDINLDLLNGNNRVDINASGAVSGAITLPDVSFIQNNLTELPQNPIDPTALLATSCIVRGERAQSSFTVTGSGGLPSRPEDTFVTSFPIGTIQTIPPEGESESAPNSNSSSLWQEGDPIVEPTGVYRLPSGKLIISRECS